MWQAAPVTVTRKGLLTYSQLLGGVILVQVVCGGSGHRPLQVLVDRGKKLLGGLPRLLRSYQERQVLGHGTFFYGLNAYPLKRLRELADGGRGVHSSTRRQGARPGEDGGDRVGGSRLALLVHPVVAGNCAVGGLGLDR